VRGRTSDLAEFRQRNAFHLGHHLRRVSRKGRFAALAAIRHGRKKRAVGFYHQFIQRCGGNGLANFVGILECYNSGEAHNGAHADYALHAR